MYRGLSFLFWIALVVIMAYCTAGWFGILGAILIYVVCFGGVWLIAKAIDNNQYYLVLHRYDKTEEELRSISFHFNKTEAKANDLITLKDEVEYIDICFKKKIVKTVKKSDFNFIDCTGADEKPTPKPTSNMFVADELKKLNELRKEGVITDEEFQDQKKRLLSYK